MKRNKHKCDKCSKLVSKTIVYKGEELCRKCYNIFMVKCEDPKPQDVLSFCKYLEDKFDNERKNELDK